MGDPVEKIDDLGELAQVRKQARRIQLKTLLAGILLTLIVLALPPWP